MELQLIRNATIRMSYHGQNLLVDPYFAEPFSLPSYTGRSRNPLTELPLAPAEILAGVDLVMVSHRHSDHFDAAAQAVLARDMPLLCQPEDEAALRELGFTAAYPVGPSWEGRGIRIARVPGRHGSGAVLAEMGPASGFFFEAEQEPSVYWAGDTILCEEVGDILLRRRPQVVIVHACGAEWGPAEKIVMDEFQTVAVCKMLPESIVVATHMEALDHATVSRQMLREYARKNQVPDEQLRIPADGELLRLDLGILPVRKP
ncbi:L-ascorbate metabolism protein UlaG (beta-lactamase superfamily) [Hydrogenispora ethanolica]|uniref:L-ascorbate metabolism protein UlaG (Beta-lactamase superfamily) n=1 Tax=Hydrogenispora ethanolica TaxID=1082276 RepID=A0A4R1S2W7_HYDET|nr:MBL fold metallo-hydrolase [Hydrogenispora ethanolica]TCL73254.1 L-ascorbate metabolism protein UlaG (beta-lactamase superfamily) [Hydrogenispora ethanolica]